MKRQRRRQLAWAAAAALFFLILGFKFGWWSGGGARPEEGHGKGASVATEGALPELPRVADSGVVMDDPVADQRAERTVEVRSEDDPAAQSAVAADPDADAAVAPVAPAEQPSAATDPAVADHLAGCLARLAQASEARDFVAAYELVEEARGLELGARDARRRSDAMLAVDRAFARVWTEEVGAARLGSVLVAAERMRSWWTRLEGEGAAAVVLRLRPALHEALARGQVGGLEEWTTLAAPDRQFLPPIAPLRRQTMVRLRDGGGPDAVMALARVMLDRDGSVSLKSVDAEGRVYYPVAFRHELELDDSGDSGEAAAEAALDMSVVALIAGDALLARLWMERSSSLGGAAVGRYAATHALCVGDPALKAPPRPGGAALRRDSDR